MSKPANNVRKSLEGRSYGSIGRAVGAGTPHISLIFRGRRTPALALAAKIAEHLGVSLDSLWTHLRVLAESDPQTPS